MMLVVPLFHCKDKFNNRVVSISFPPSSSAFALGLIAFTLKIKGAFDLEQTFSVKSCNF